MCINVLSESAFYTGYNRWVVNYDKLIVHFKADKQIVLDFMKDKMRNGDYMKVKVYLKEALIAGSANKNLKAITKKASIEKHISFHSSRHTWATRALRKGMRIEHVSKLMGHANIKITQIYAKIVSSDLDNAMNVFND